MKSKIILMDRGDTRHAWLLINYPLWCTIYWINWTLHVWKLEIKTQSEHHIFLEKKINVSVFLPPSIPYSSN